MQTLTSIGIINKSSDKEKSFAIDFLTALLLDEVRIAYFMYIVDGQGDNSHISKVNQLVSEIMFLKSTTYTRET